MDKAISLGQSVSALIGAKSTIVESTVSLKISAESIHLKIVSIHELP